MARSTEYEKVFLHNRGEDVETVWAEPCGKVAQGRLFRLANVPFLHARPTFGDVIVAKPDADLDMDWAWDRRGLPFSRVDELIHEDGGRYAAIVDYRMKEGSNYTTLAKWLLKTWDVQPEGAWGPVGKRPGRLYMALPLDLDVDVILEAMRAQFKGFTFTLIHPTSAKIERRSMSEVSPHKKSSTVHATLTKARPVKGKRSAAPAGKRAARKKSAATRTRTVKKKSVNTRVTRKAATPTRRKARVARSSRK